MKLRQLSDIVQTRNSSHSDVNEYLNGLRKNVHKVTGKGIAISCYLQTIKVAAYVKLVMLNQSTISMQSREQFLIRWGELGKIINYNLSNTFSIIFNADIPPQKLS